MIYSCAKEYFPPESNELAEALGWTDIKSWGGRGVRGIAPGETRHQSVPRFSVHIEDLLRGLQRLPKPPQVELKLCGRNARGISASVGKFGAVGDADDADYPSGVLAVAAYRFLTEQEP